MKRLALLLHHGGTAPDLIYPSLQKLDNVEIVTFYIKSPTNEALNKLYDDVVGTIGDGIECKSDEDMVNKVISYNETKKIDGVLTFAEMLLKALSQICENLNIPYMDIHTIDQVQNKILQRKRLQEKGVPVPNFYEIKSENDLVTASDKIGFPSLLKPNFGGGGYGIFEVNNIEELKERYREQLDNYENIIVEGKDSTFNLEEKMVGASWNSDERIADYASVESIIINNHVYNLTVTDRTKLYSPYRESGYITPTSLDQNRVNELYEITTKALEALELNNIMTHTEIKFTEGGPKIIEVNARPGGTTPFRINNATNGEYDVFYELAKLALGMPVNTEIKFKKYAASKVSLCPEGSWRIKNIDFSGLDDIQSLDLKIPIGREGQKITSYRGIEDLLGLYYLTNENLNDLINDMYLIDEKLVVDYDPM